MKYVYIYDSVNFINVYQGVIVKVLYLLLD